IEGGSEWQREINNGLRRMEIMVSVLTKSSTDPKRNHPNRNWIFYEQEQAQNLFVPILPIYLEKCDIPQHLQKIQFIDFTDASKREESYEELVRLLHANVRRQGISLFDETPNLSRP